MRILLVCNAGMSTGIMQMKLEEQAKLKGIEASIEAIPISEIEVNLEGCDCILLGPQVRFAQQDIETMVQGKIPVLTIGVQDFGLMRAEKVFQEVLSAIQY